MKFAILILSIAISGIASYYTLTQSQKFQDIQQARFDAIDTNERIKGNIEKQLAEIETKEAELKAARDALAVAQASLSTKKSDTNQLLAQASSIDAKITEQQAQIDELNQLVAGLKQELAPLNIDITLGTIGDALKGLQTSLEERQKKDQELDKLLEDDEKMLADKRAEIDGYNKRIQARDLRMERNEVEARVTAVNHDWGFLVIGAGSNSGFAPDTSLLIKRDGRYIATVRPTAIEQTQTIADIDLKSLVPGVRIQPGDQVMLANPSPY